MSFVRAGSVKESSEISVTNATQGTNLERPRFYDLKLVGTSSWYTIHLLAANGEAVALGALLNVFSKRFVCPKCREHIDKALKLTTAPLSGEDPRTLFDWTIMLHNKVNERLGKTCLTRTGSDLLFYELTEGADEDGKVYIDTGECEGCENTNDFEKYSNLLEATTSSFSAD
jgi:hypothetical protein